MFSFVAENFKHQFSTRTVFLVGTGESFMNVQGICGRGQPFCEAKFFAFCYCNVKNLLSATSSYFVNYKMERLCSRKPERTF